MRYSSGYRIAFAPVFVSALLAGSRVDAQSVAPARPVKRDTASVARLQDRLVAQVDSLRRMLDQMSLEDPDRAPLAHRIDATTAMLHALVQASVELHASIAPASIAPGGPVEGFVKIAGGPIELRRVRPSQAQPSGWLGLIIEGTNKTRIENDTAFIRYFDYPAVVSVDPNSPAARAGILRGDILMAYDGNDVRDRDINMSQLLIPAKRIVVTVKRDGETREYEMNVAKASDEILRVRTAFNRAGFDTAIIVRATPAPPRAPVMSIRGKETGVESRGNFFFEVPKVEANQGVFWGATVVTVNEGMASWLGLRAGVFVTSVADGSPASMSKLKSGDVIVRAGDRAVESFNDLLRLAGEHVSDRSLDLEVRRAKETKPIRLTLRWAR